MTELLLEVDSLRKEFGGLVAVNDVDLNIAEGSIVSLIGLYTETHQKMIPGSILVVLVPQGTLVERIRVQSLNGPDEAPCQQQRQCRQDTPR